MNNIKNTALILFLAFSLGSFSVVANAEATTHSPNQAIMHLEKAKVEIMHNDFVPPSEHLKAARTEAQKVTGKPDVVKKAFESIIQAQIKIKDGDLKGATDQMNRALELYKSLK
ncbi:MAG: hypothetical protein ACU83V_12910 [Gammaproteobacteria bacterium]